MVAIVKIVELMKAVQSFALESGSTVGDLFEQADRDFPSKEDGYEVTRKGVKLTKNDTIYDGDTIYVAQLLKGNADPFEVEFCRIGGGAAITYPAQDGMTLKAIMDQFSSEEKAQFFRSNGTPAFEFRVNGQLVTVDATPSRPESGKMRVICSQVYKGNLIQVIRRFIASLLS